MLLKIKREVCLARYRNFPLCSYDPNSDEEVFYFPKVFKRGWYEIPSAPKRTFSKRLVTELIKFITTCKFDRMIFLSDNVSPWVTKLSASRTDYPPLINAVAYFEKNKLGKKYNGGIEVPMIDLPEFFKHYFCITQCDASFHSGYFCDPAQSFIGNIHYSGEVQICALTKKFDSIFTEVLPETKFQRSDR